MGLPEKLLGRDEVVIRHMHEHIKALFLNLLALLAIIVVVVLALIYLPDSLQPWANWAVGITGVVLALILFGYPWLQWVTATYTITSRRIITRSGIISKTGHDIPLSRISNVSYRHDFIDRIFGCGTLILETSAGNPLELHDVPDVEKVHVELTELLFGDAQAAADVDLDH